MTVATYLAEKQRDDDEYHKRDTTAREARKSVRMGFQKLTIPKSLGEMLSRVAEEPAH